MKMSDKELDQLFSNQLNDLEIEPSAELWGRIAPKIPGNKTRSGMGPMISIAATLLILLTAGLLFMPRTQKLALHGHYDPRQSINEAVAAVTQRPSTIEEPQDEPAEQSVAQQTINTTPVIAKPLVREGVITETDVQPLVTRVDTIQHLTLTKPININRPEHHEDIPKPITANTIASIAPKTIPAVNPVKALTANTTPDAKANQTIKKKKIHSLGDLLNVVIAKVDKRDNKIIQFGQNDDDEDELLNVTGVNLGPIKVKKQN